MVKVSAYGDLMVCFGLRRRLACLCTLGHKQGSNRRLRHDFPIFDTSFEKVYRVGRCLIVIRFMQMNIDFNLSTE